MRRSWQHRVKRMWTSSSRAGNEARRWVSQFTGDVTSVAHKIYCMTLAGAARGSPGLCRSITIERCGGHGVVIFTYR